MIYIYCLEWHSILVARIATEIQLTSRPQHLGFHGERLLLRRSSIRPFVAALEQGAVLVTFLPECALALNRYLKNHLGSRLKLRMAKR